MIMNFDNDQGFDKGYPCSQNFLPVQSPLAFLSWRWNHRVTQPGRKLCPFLQNIDLFFWLFGCVLKASVCSCIVLDIYLSFWYPSLIPCNNQYGDEVRDKSSFSPLLKVGLRVVLITLIFGDHYRALIGLIFLDPQREGPIRSLLSVCMSVCMPRKQTVNFVQIGAYDFFKLCTMKENITTYQMVKNPISIDLLVPLFGGP